MADRFIVISPKQTLSLSSANTWGKFPGLEHTFNLSHTSTVAFTYTITLSTSPDNHFCTKLVIDSVEQETTRTISGNIAYHSNTATIFKQLAPGNHTAEVQYRTPGTVSNLAVGDWNTHNLTITILQ